MNPKKLIHEKFMANKSELGKLRIEGSRQYGWLRGSHPARRIKELEAENVELLAKLKA